MFSGFNLKLSEDFFGKRIDSYIDIWEENSIQRIDEYRNNLEKYIMFKNDDEKVLYGNKIQEDWFPQVKANVFISHSHDDKDLANAFAGWLYDKFELTSFIDSDVWGYVDDLLYLLNNEYTAKQYTNELMGFYLPEDYNRAAQHAYIMLLMALQNMIDKVECVFLLNTDNSINVFDGKHFNLTYSPWIYSEILCTKLVRKKPLLYYRRIQKSIMESFSHSDALNIVYDVPLDHLRKIKDYDLENWENIYINNEKKFYCPLDALYTFTYEKQYKEIYNL